ncbi:MAG TPA: hypothetical protein VFK70_06730, partial [Vicinamibacteria bacterium]|nr:hypothetical protein [Vicinamibacteria bacterium]
YNLRRKVILHVLWALVPAALLVDASLGGLVDPGHGFLVNLSRLWLALGIGAVLFRTVHLFFLRDVQTGLVWMTKILTDPFHDIKLYHRAPMQLWRGEMLDPVVPAGH